MIIYRIDGDPIALARAKLSGKGRKPHLYNPQNTLQLVTGITLSGQHGDHPAYTGPLKLSCVFYMAIPPRNGKKRELNDYHDSPPDNSNLVKFIEDVCQKIEMFKNDCQIAWIESVKVWDPIPRLEFTIKELPRNHTFKRCSCG